MDIPVKSVRSKRRFRKVVLAAIALCAVLLLTMGLSRLKPAAPSVDRATVWVDSVKRGEMLRQVRGTGTFVPEDVRVIAAATEGRVERISVEPGAAVSAGTVLIELTNPQLQQEVLDSEFQLKAAEADYNNLKVKLESARMTQQSTTASVKADYQQSKIQSDADEQLAKDGLLPMINLKLSKVKTEELSNRYEIERKRLEIDDKSVELQLASQQARIQQLRALTDLKRQQADTMRVVAGTGGVLQQMLVEVGQQVQPGTNLARVVEPRNLKAQLKIAETQAKDIQLGQRAEIDTRNGVVPGHVTRIDPAAQQGTVTIDVALEGELPQGARPDQSIDGTIELERLSDIIYMGRPATGQAQSTISMFKLEADGKSAIRVQVKLGRSSVNTIEVLEGVQPGDQLILSDTSQWDAYDRILLN